MFRTQANPMDDAIVKATDENLVNENWEYILDVCDRVSNSPSGPQQAVAALIKRLAHRNANVQLYTLELANALSQNCGPALHRELASKAFTEALLRLAGERNTHAQVKQKVLERMGTWTEEFGRSPEFGIMEQAYHKLRTSQPSLMPPNKPGKREISSEDKKKEEEELQMALALSVQDNKTKGSGSVRDDSQIVQTQAQPGVTQAQAQGTTAATVSRVRALYDFTPSEPGELAFKKNDIIAVLESVYKDWWKGSLRGSVGIFPLNYVEKLQDPTKEELERDAHMEAEVFGEIKNVEKLLALLSVRTEGSGAARRGEREEDEISELYQRTLSIRPKLIELIGKYSQKKDDFTQLNEKFIKARRDYEALLESSMAHPQQYQQYPVRPRQHSGPMYPQQAQQQRHTYNHQIPPAGYPPQGQLPAGYQASQQPYASQTHLPPQQQQQQPPPQHDPQQRFFSPAPPSESVPPAGYAGSPYISPNGPTPPQQQQNGPAAFHFIPGGVQAPPDPSLAVRRKLSPQAAAQQGPQAPPPSEMGGAPSGHTYSGQGIFHGQIRPNSIHTLNSGNPQELATGGYESPVDNRRSYPSAASLSGPAQQQQIQQQIQQPQQTHQPSYDGYAPTATQSFAPSQQSSGYPSYAQQQQQQQQQQEQPSVQHPPPQSQTPTAPSNAIPTQTQSQARSDLNSLPSRQRTQSFESPTSLYSAQLSTASDNLGFPSIPPLLSQQIPPQPQHAPPQPLATGPPSGMLASPPTQPGAYQAYQAYNPGYQQPRQGNAAPAAANDDDPGEFYR